MQPVILYEDNHIIAVHKPAGWLVQGDETGDATLGDWVKSYIKIQYQKPGAVFLGTIHRLDRPTSGVVLFARTSKALTRMNKLFQDRKVEKTYWAVVDKKPKKLQGRLEHYLLKDTKINKVKAYDNQDPKGKRKRAVLNYAVKAGYGGYYILEIDLETGRPHQIRAQLTKMGRPIRGDIKYGYPKRNRDGSIHLHCRKMAFIHPVKKERIEVVADPITNDQIWQLFTPVWS